MNNVNTQAFEQLEKRVSKLEELRETDYDKLTNNHKELALIVTELKYITKTMESLSNDLRETIRDNNLLINNRIDTLTQDVNNLKTKFENTTNDLEDKVDERTIVKDSNMWNKVTWLVISGFIGSIITFICTKIIK